MIPKVQIEKAKKFYELHHSDNILVLPNVWDATSTKIFEIEGFNALATASAGVSAVLGYADGQAMSFYDSTNLLERIIKSTNLPVSVDIEAGYSTNIDEILKVVNSVIELGGVGINLEDSTGDCSGNPLNNLFTIEEQKNKITAIRKFCDDKNFPLFINARTDVFLISKESQSVKINEAVNRAEEYLDAGANSIFLPDVGDFDKEIISILAKEIDAPINIIAGGHIPPIKELQDIGVARVSFGPRAMRAILDNLRSIAKEIYTKGTYSQIADTKITYDEVNSWFKN